MGLSQNLEYGRVIRGIYSPTMENHMDEHMEHDMEAVVM